MFGLSQIYLLCSCGLQASNPRIKIISQPTGQTAADGSSLSPGNILLGVNVDNFIVSQENMGVFNRIATPVVVSVSIDVAS
jgi:hypothetical protein